MNPDKEIIPVFDAEREKLYSMIDTALSKSEFSLAEIVRTYYQIINVTSIIATLSQQFEEPDERRLLANDIEKTRRFISGKFDSNLHPTIMKHLASSIADITKNLQSSNNLEKSKEDIESEAKLYDQLRETMSTKEFVDQYDKGLPSYD